MLKVETVKKILGSYAEQFNIYEKNGSVIAKPKKRIPKEDFSEIGKLVKQEGGDYVKFDYGTKEGGYYRFKGETAVSTATLDDNKNNLYKDIFAYADNIEKESQIIKEKLRLLGYTGN